MDAKMKVSSKIAFAIYALLIITISRLASPPFFQHIMNFSPLATLALFATVFFGRRKFALIPALLMVLLSDWAVNYIYYDQASPFYTGFYWQYIGYGLLVLLGADCLPDLKLTRVACVSIAGTLLFYLISNFGVWTSGFYAMNTAGLMECYFKALPFLKHSLAANLLFALIFAAGYRYLLGDERDRRQTA